MLGIATIKDRVVQAALQTVLEPIFEVDFHRCGYGFCPGRRAQDAIAEIHNLTSCSYEWAVESDIKACFESWSGSALRRGLAWRRTLPNVDVHVMRYPPCNGLSRPAAGLTRGIMS
jgi:Reverse transcriptase (RNA-dependent DNA polymerase)